MEILEAISQRQSIRAFKPDPVPRELIEQILGLAQRAPSWANTQPWEFVIVSGKPLKEIQERFIANLEAQSTPDVPRPQEFPEPYGTRRGDLSGKLLEIRGVQREDKGGRRSWRLEGLRHFGAPSVIYICTERAMYYQSAGINSWSVFDCGSVAQNIMLVATKFGLGAIIQAEAVIYPHIVKSVLGLPDSTLLLVGMAIGYPNWDDPINRFKSGREPLSNITRWYGFEK